MRVALFYFALYASVGIMLPYLPPYFRSLGFSGKEIAAAASLQPLLMIVVPPVWGYLADRSRRPVTMLRIACTGAALAFVPMLFASRFVSVVACLAIFSLFSTTISSLADSVAVVEARRIGTDYARLRLWGSVGFVFASWSFGAWLSWGGSASDAVWAALIAMTGYAVASRFLRPGESSPLAVPSLREVGGLLRDPGLVLFLLAGMIQWAALAPYHLLFAMYLRDLGASPVSIGGGFAFAVTAEVLVMWRFRSLLQRLPLAPVLLLAFCVGIVRWILTGFAPNGTTVAAIQVLHGLTYGGFYVGSIAWLERVVPARMRATGRALFASVVFGLGGILGNSLAGALYDVGGGKLAFFGAAALNVLAPLFFLAAMRRAPRDEAQVAGA